MKKEYIIALILAYLGIFFMFIGAIFKVIELNQEVRASNNSFDKIYRCRYIDRLTIEKTARISNYSRSQVFNILKEIRKHLK